MGDKYCTFTRRSRTTMRSYLLSKLNMPRLSMRKWTKLLMMMLHRCVEGLYRSYSLMMYSWVWISVLPHEQLVERWGKNLCLYSLIGVWPVVMWVKQAHNELVNPIEGSHKPPLLYVGFMTFWFLFLKLKKHWPFLGLIIKESYHSWRILSHSFFWLNRCDSLLGKTGVQLSALT